MSTIQPPPASPTGVAPPTPTTLPIITVSNATTELLQLPPGAQLSAQVVAAALRDAVEIETPLGRFVVETPLNLKTGQPLLLQIAPKTGGGSAALVLHVLEIAGKPAPGVLLLQSTNPGVPPVAGNTTTAGANVLTSTPVGPTTLTLSVGSTIGATLLTSSPAFTVTPGGGYALTPSTLGPLAATGQPGTGPNIGTLPGQTTITSSPSGGGPGSATQTPGSLAQGGTPQATGGTLQSQGAQPGTVMQHAAGSYMTLSIESITPPSPGGSTASLSSGVPTPFLAGQSVTGLVTGATAAGHTVVHTPAASISVATAQSLPPGTEITFRVESAPLTPTNPQTMSPSLHREGMLAAQTWPSLEEGLTVLQTVNPTIANQLANQIIPKLNVQFTATTLFFLSALRSGDVRSWIGDSAAKILDRVRPDAMKRLGDDFRAMSAIDDDGRGPARTIDWRGTLVPFQSPDGLEQIRLYTRQLRDEEEDDEEQRGTGNRFLIDVTLSNLGRLQLDGMIEKLQKRLDLIVRTSRPLPPMVRNDMMDLFSKSNEIVGMHGGMSFQAAPNAFVEIESPTQSPEQGLGIVV